MAFTLSCIHHLCNFEFMSFCVFLYGIKKKQIIQNEHLSKVWTLENYSAIINIPIEELIGSSRIPRIALARQVYWYYLRKYTYSFDRIGRMFGRKRPTILSGVRTIKNLIQTKDSCIDDYLRALDLFYHKDLIQ